MKIFEYLSTPLSSSLSIIPMDSKSVCLTPKSENTLGQEPGFSLSKILGGAMTTDLPSSSCASIAEIYVFPSPTTSEIKTPPYSSSFIFASLTASF